MIRKATAQDTDQINAIYNKIHAMEKAGKLTIGWKQGIYPVRKTAEAAVKRGDMFVLESEGKIVASGIINNIQGEEYSRCPWKISAPKDEVMVLHTLCVAPDVSGRGYGRQFIAFYEDWAKKNGCTALRIDTQTKNTVARSLYTKLGYVEAGVVPCDFNGIKNVFLMCLEKRI